MKKKLHLLLLLLCVMFFAGSKAIGQDTAELYECKIKDYTGPNTTATFLELITKDDWRGNGHFSSCGDKWKSGDYVFMNECTLGPIKYSQYLKTYNIYGELLSTHHVILNVSTEKVKIFSTDYSPTYKHDEWEGECKYVGSVTDAEAADMYRSNSSKEEFTEFKVKPVKTGDPLQDSLVNAAANMDDDAFLIFVLIMMGVMLSLA